MRVAFYTLGCKVNQYETEAMRALFAAAGHHTVDFDEEADVYVVNTCTVTNTGDKKSRQMISRARKKAPHAQIVVTGCYSQRAPEEVIKLPGVALVLGTKDRLRIVELVEAAGKKTANAVAKLGPNEAFEPLSAMREGKTRAYLKIQDGCDRFCTYCVIPYVRGGVRSRALPDVKKEMESLAQAGFCEIVLTGIHLMSYGKDLKGGISLLDAIAQANDIDGVRRIRLSSLEPQFLGDDFVLALARNPKVCRHFHLSMQSGSESVLKRMARRYTPSEYADCVKRLKEKMPGCAVTTDVIAGFPGETQAEFEETLDFVREMGFARIHVFPYSRREGTKAAKMEGQLPQNVKAERAARLIGLGKELEREYALSHLEKTVGVLFETYADGVVSGHTDTYLYVGAKGAPALVGSIGDVRIKDVFTQPIEGVIMEPGGSENE